MCAKLSSTTGELGRRQAQPVVLGPGQRRVSLTLVRGAAGLTPKIHPRKGMSRLRQKTCPKQVPEPQVLQARTDSQDAEVRGGEAATQEQYPGRRAQVGNGLWGQTHLCSNTSPVTNSLCEHGQPLTLAKLTSTT